MTSNKLCKLQKLVCEKGCLRTITPKAIPMPGTTRDSQPFALAIPQAVVGPPILALDAKSISFKSKLNKLSQPYNYRKMDGYLDHCKYENTRGCLDHIPYTPTSSNHSKKYLRSNISCYLSILANDLWSKQNLNQFLLYKDELGYLRVQVQENPTRGKHQMYL